MPGHRRPNLLQEGKAGPEDDTEMQGLQREEKGEGGNVSEWRKVYESGLQPVAQI